LNQVARTVLQHYLAAADDSRSMTLGECKDKTDWPIETWAIVEAFDKLLAAGLLRVVPGCRLMMLDEKTATHGNAMEAFASDRD
jgi:hypothetical protein